MHIFYWYYCVTCLHGMKRKVLHGRMLSNGIMFAISTGVWSGVILLVWNTHIRYFMIYVHIYIYIYYIYIYIFFTYTHTQRDRYDINTNLPVTDLLQVPGHFSTPAGWCRHNSCGRPQSFLWDAGPGNCVRDSICLMYAIYGNIWGILMVNVTIYGIHGSYGNVCSCRNMWIIINVMLYYLYLFV